MEKKKEKRKKLQNNGKPSDHKAMELTLSS